MKAVLVEVPQSLLEERRRHGADVFDEMWEGVLHMNPPPSAAHQRLGADLLLVLGPVAKAQGLIPWYETGLYQHADDYRCPDLSFSRPENEIKAGINGAELVVEIRSPGDESYDKLDWYVARAVNEILVLHPDTRVVELFRSIDARLVLVQPDADGLFTLTTLSEVRVGPVETADRHRLRVVTAAEKFDI
ncbi:MAG: Uma2 family endonuclease [Acidimicrobiales bacterium]